MQLEEFIRVTLCCFAGQGYGLTETCSATCLAPPDIFDMLGCIGPVQMCADCKVVSVPELGYDAKGEIPRGELLLSGPCLFSGYYRALEDTERVLGDGWFRTGDCVEILPNGSLRIIDRIKHICKMGQGEYIALEAVETALLGGGADVIANGCCWVYADSMQRRPVAVVVPNKDALIGWAYGEGQLRNVYKKAGYEGLCGHPKSAAFILSKLDTAGKERQLLGFQRPAAVHLEPEEWTVESGLLTPTHKLRRHMLQKHYAGQIASMYANLE